MTRVLAIDPGSSQSAWIITAGEAPEMFGILPNAELLVRLRQWHELPLFDRVAIEKVEGFGMAVGAEVFETVFWSGRFAEAVCNLPLARIGRKAVKIALCGSPKAKDPNIRQALIDRYGGPDAIRKGGALYGVSKDVWAALAVAVTFLERITELDAGAELGL